MSRGRCTSEACVGVQFRALPAGDRRPSQTPSSSSALWTLAPVATAIGMEDALARLHIASSFDDDDERPIFRSCHVDAHEDWLTPGEDLVHKDAGHYQKGQGPAMRCVPGDEWADCWDLDDVQTGLLGDTPTQNLVVTLAPHRVEGRESLVCSLRQFTVSIGLVDGATGAPIPSWTSRGIESLRASLVYADSGEPVPAQRGEAPLTGEITNSTRPHEGTCQFKVRIAATSYHHGRRPFAIRIDTYDASGSHLGSSACSQPIRALARLPNQVDQHRPATSSDVDGRTGSSPPAALESPAATLMPEPASTSTLTVEPAPLRAAGHPACHAAERVCPPTIVSVDDDASR